MRSFALDTIRTEELKQSYREDGYVVITGAMAESDLAEINTELKRISRGDYESDVIEAVACDLDDENLLGRHMYIGMPHVLSDAINHFVKHLSLLRILDHIVGEFVPFWDGGYRCVQTMFVNKDPNGKGSPWHQDEHPIPTRDRSLTGVWIPTCDVDEGNGCLWVIPQTHKTGIIYDRHDHDDPKVDFHPEARGFDDSNACPVPMRAGSVLFFSGYLLHSSKPNLSAACRPVLTLHYTSATTWLTWRGEKNYRGIVPIRGEDPYASEGYTTPQPWVHTAGAANRR